MKSIYQFLAAFLILFSSFSSLTFATPALSEKSLMTPSKWYWLTGVTADKLKDKIDDGYRIFDLEVESHFSL